jgi:hypothetical protein
MSELWKKIMEAAKANKGKGGAVVALVAVAVVVWERSKKVDCNLDSQVIEEREFKDGKQRVYICKYKCSDGSTPTKEDLSPCANSY